MGCFSFKCKTCGQPINSNSFRGEQCVLFLIKDGEIIESMEGEYDSYGRVFNNGGHSVEWEIPWNDICDLMFDKKKNNGMAAFHLNCYDGTPPTEESEDDPNQGWGKFKIPSIPYQTPQRIS